MDFAQDLEEYFGTNPVSFFKLFAEKNNWDVIAETGASTAFYVEGIWRSYLCCFYWMEADQNLRITCEYDLKLPEKKSDPLYRTLNLANEKCEEGFFTYCENQNSLIFHNQFKGSDALEIGALRSKEIVSDITNIMDELYPVFQLISWGDENPDMALRLAGNQVSGFI